MLKSFSKMLFGSKFAPVNACSIYENELSILFSKEFALEFFND